MVSFDKDKAASPLVSAIIMLILGILIFVLSGDQIKFIGAIIAGVLCIIAGLVPMIKTKKADAIGIIKVLIGIVLLIAPVFIADVIFIILGVVLIIVGLLAIVEAVSEQGNDKTMSIIYAIVLIVLGVLIGFFFNEYKTIIGIIFIIAGALNIVKALI